MGPSQGEKALFGGPEYVFLEILANRAQKVGSLADTTHVGLIC